MVVAYNPAACPVQFSDAASPDHKQCHCLELASYAPILLDMLKTRYQKMIDDVPGGYLKSTSIHVYVRKRRHGTKTLSRVETMVVGHSVNWQKHSRSDWFVFNDYTKLQQHLAIAVYNALLKSRDICADVIVAPAG